MTTHAHKAGEFGPSKLKKGLTKAQDPAHRAARAEHYAGVAKKAAEAHATATSKADKAKHALVVAHAVKKAEGHAKAARKYSDGGNTHGMSADHAEHHAENARTHAAGVTGKSAIGMSTRVPPATKYGSDHEVKTSPSEYSKYAKKASAFAQASGSAAAHADAAEAHYKAQDAHESKATASGKDMSNKTAAKVDEHRSATIQHEHQAKMAASTGTLSLSNTANQMSAAAHKSNSDSDHDLASGWHAKAANSHYNAGDTKAGDKHQAKAVEHDAEARKIRAKKARSNDYSK